MVDAYVMDRLAGRDGLAKGTKESPRTLRVSEYQNRVRAGEVMRAGGCAEQGVRQDRRDQGMQDPRGLGRPQQHGLRRVPDLRRVRGQGADDRGVEGAVRLQAPPRHTSRSDPTSSVVKAMSDAIHSLRQAEVRLGAPWGTLQVAGDRGAPPIPLGGGSGDAAGNANALASYEPRANRHYYRPVTYGSSHIQAVAFLSGGRVDARTILTYGQSEDPTSPLERPNPHVLEQEVGHLRLHPVPGPPAAALHHGRAGGLTGQTFTSEERRQPAKGRTSSRRRRVRVPALTSVVSVPTRR